MAKKTETKQIAINQWEKLLDNKVQTLPLVEGDEKSPVIEVRPLLPMDEMWDVVDEMVEYCIPTVNTGTEDEPKEEIVFMPENRDFALRRVVVSRYGNLRLPKDSAKQYELLYCTNVFQRIVGMICQDQLREICTAVDRKVEYRKDAMLSITTALRELFGQFIGMTDKLGDIDPEAVQKALGYLTDTKAAGQKVIEQALQDAAKESKDLETAPDLPAVNAPGDNIVYLKQ